MPPEMLNSTALINAILMVMLLVWLVGSAVLTLLAGHAARRQRAEEAHRGGGGARGWRSPEGSPDGESARS
jgi:threonine/homoserine/homoserine lactone efflux protein